MMPFCATTSACKVPAQLCYARGGVVGKTPTHRSFASGAFGQSGLPEWLDGAYLYLKLMDRLDL